MTETEFGQDISAPSIEDVREAARTLQGHVIRTPLVENRDVNAHLGGRLLLKCENMQRTGAFKFRGAYMRISQMSEAQKSRGVIAYSSGNHAQGVALAAQILGTSAIIVMPNDAPVSKIEATRKLGAEIVFFDRLTDDSNIVVREMAREANRTIVPPSEDCRILAGGGTVALEILEDCTDIDAVIVPCGGGGIAAATAIVMNDMSAKTKVYGAEPNLFDDTKRSLAAGVRVVNPKRQKTICDAIMTPTPNPLTFSINRELLEGVVTATDDEVCDAMLFAFQNFKIVVEPGAAVGIAGILNGQIDIKDKVVVVVITGGNVDVAKFNKCLETAVMRA